MAGTSAKVMDGSTIHVRPSTPIVPTALAGISPCPRCASGSPTSSGVRSDMTTYCLEGAAHRRVVGMLAMGFGFFAIVAATVPCVNAAPAFQYVRTESGRVRCIVQPDKIACEASGPGSTGFPQAPISLPESQCRNPCPGGVHLDLAEVTSSGAFHWDDGNIGGAGPDWAQTDTTLNYGQAYHILGWTILPSADGTRFTNDGTGRGMFVSIDNVAPF